MIDTGIILNEDTGDLIIDVKRDANGLITSGLVLGQTTYQNINLVMLANKGEFKEYPVLGVSPERYLKSVGRVAELRRECAIQLGAIGYPKASIKISDTGKVEIEV